MALEEILSQEEIEALSEEELASALGYSIRLEKSLKAEVSRRTGIDDPTFPPTIVAEANNPPQVLLSYIGHELHRGGFDIEYTSLKEEKYIKVTAGEKVIHVLSTSFEIREIPDDLAAELKPDEDETS